MSNTEKKTKMTEHEDLIRDLTSEQMCEEHLPRIFELSSFKEKELLFLKSAFESGATIAKNRTQYRADQETFPLLKQIEELKKENEVLKSTYLWDVVKERDSLQSELTSLKAKMEEAKKETAIKFLDSIMEYEAENRKMIAHDERTSEELSKNDFVRFIYWDIVKESLK